MIVAIGISIALNILEGAVIFLLLKQVKEDKKTISVQQSNIQELKLYYSGSVPGVLNHIKAEQEVANGTKENAESAVAAIIADNNKRAAAVLSDDSKNRAK